MEFDKVIKSISYNQHEILYNIMQLYNNGEPFECDMTYSKGKFYGSFNIKKHDGTSANIVIPEPKYKFDINPQTEDTIKADARSLPLDDNSVNCIMFDPPFLATTGKSITANDNNNFINKRFGVFPNEKELHQISFTYDDMAIVKKMKEIVPEFKSRHSKYCALD